MSMQVKDSSRCVPHGGGTRKIKILFIILVLLACAINWLELKVEKRAFIITGGFSGATVATQDEHRYIGIRETTLIEDIIRLFP